MAYEILLAELKAMNEADAKAAREAEEERARNAEERERCARVAESYIVRGPSRNMDAVIQNQTARAIADEIRHGAIDD